MKSTTLLKIRHLEEKCIFENHISFLKYVAKIFCISYYFQKKLGECFKMQLSDAVSAYILSSKGGNQLQVLYRRTLGNINETFSMESFSTEAKVFNCIPGNFFLKICSSFRTTSKKLVLENYVVAYHAANKYQIL